MIDKNEGEARNLPRKQTETCRQSLAPFISPVNTPLPQVKPIRLYPELCIASLCRHPSFEFRACWDKELSLWMELKALNVSHSGNILFDKVSRFFVPRVYSEKTLHRLLLRGEGFFWEVNNTRSGRRILIYSLADVCRFFNVRHLSKPVEIDPEKFIYSSRQSKRAYLYISFHPPKNSKKSLKPLSRERIERATGIDRKSQRRYEKALGIRVIPNFAYLENSQGRMEALFRGVEGAKGRLYKVRARLGNSFEISTLEVSGSFVKKVNKILNGGFVKLAKHAERYFFPGTGLGKRLSRRDRSHDNFLWKGKGQWCLV